MWVWFQKAALCRAERPVGASSSRGLTAAKEKDEERQTDKTSKKSPIFCVEVRKDGNIPSQPHTHTLFNEQKSFSSLFFTFPPSPRASVEAVNGSLERTMHHMLPKLGTQRRYSGT
jgi:hypothetical protein